ncbi:MAG TPA: hypothetical protein VNW92_13485 [Polyangiaceae bacterium]|nr:hypothetical protein [Polyangiaceae bacterium]
MSGNAGGNAGTSAGATSVGGGGPDLVPPTDAGTPNDGCADSARLVYVISDTDKAIYPERACAARNFWGLARSEPQKFLGRSIDSGY